jgi:hypothetical protein
MCLALSAAAMARPSGKSKPWESKAISEWSERDVQSILTASPWARTLVVHASPPFTRDNIPWEPDGAGVDRSDGGEKFRTHEYLIRWDSARPIQEALRRTRQRGPVYVPLSTETAERYYVVSVTIVWPASVDTRDFEEVDEKQRNRIVRLTRLRRVSHADLHPCEVAGKKGNVLYRLRFPKTDPITPEDASVEFLTEAVPTPVKQVFSLSEMWFQGKLAV